MNKGADVMNNIPQIYIKYLGIDFGSSSVSVVGYENYNTEPIIFYNPVPLSKTTKFATAMAKDDNGNYVFFDDAVQQITHPLINSLKESLAIDDPCENVQLFISKLFDSISQCRSSSGEYNFSQLERICFGYPTYTETEKQNKYNENLRNIIVNSCRANGINISAEQIISIPEPMLAAMAFNEVNKNSSEYKNTINHGDLILVVDLGGYTLDMIIVRAEKSTNDDIRLFDGSPPKSIIEEKEDGRDIKLGKRITKDICVQIFKGCENQHMFDYNVDEQKCEYFKNINIATAPKNLQFKEKLSDQPTTEISKFVLQYDQKDKSLIDNTVYVGMNSSEDGRSIDIEDSFNLCAEYVESYIYINSVFLNNKKISHVLFTGGTSEIKDLRKAITGKLKQYFEKSNGKTDISELLLETKYDNAVKLKIANQNTPTKELSFENIVALGAAWVAARDPSDDDFASFHNPKPDISYKEQYDRLKERHQKLINSILAFRDKEQLCDDCSKKFLEFLSKTEY